MLIKEVCEECKLTKKAIEYYEAKDLIRPQIRENGYRDYSDDDVSTLKEISVLRKCGIGISDIADILKSSHKSVALARSKYLTELQMQRMNVINECLTHLIDDYDIEREFRYLQSHAEDFHTIKEKLALAFPGNYGILISLHFGRYLTETIDSDEKRLAYEAIVRYLDNVNVSFPAKLSAQLESIYENIDMADMESKTNSNMQEMIADTDGYLERNHEMIERYMEFKQSEEYKHSEAAELQTAILAFQKQSGYQEVLIANMKVLSASYREYLRLVEVANQRLLEKYPEADKMYQANQNNER